MTRTAAAIGIKGSNTALITPFKGGKVDAVGFKRFVDWQIAEGTHGLVPVGTTGETPTLSHEEHIAVVQMCVEAARRRVPVIAGAGSNSTDEAIMLTKAAKDAGAEATLHSTGYYNKPTQDGLYLHFKAISDAIDLPIIVYNVPGRSVVDIGAETFARICGLKNVVGIKDATSNLQRQSQHRQLLGDKRDRTWLHGARRSRCHLRDVERRAAPVCDVPGNLPQGRLRARSETARPFDAAA
jgi:4-hydroxy-tetrahydrodipicolinate synthase